MKNLKYYIWRYSYFFVLEGDIPGIVSGFTGKIQINGISYFPYMLMSPGQLEPLTKILVSEQTKQHPKFAEASNHRLVYFSLLGKKFILFKYLWLMLTRWIKNEKES